ncbi:hypothetical protein LCGC14_2986500 [marine sediment metagenome]|uniref:Uncharacterized protein n=1 Tax=marine sediment metagenome TaxID=412755 RepID=A0A0F8ZCH9_9ZZZZ
MGNNTTKLTITMSPNGEVRVHGPIDNGILCFGLLEVAKDVIRERIKKKAVSPIIQPITRVVLPGNGGT